MSYLYTNLVKREKSKVFMQAVTPYVEFISMSAHKACVLSLCLHLLPLLSLILLWPQVFLTHQTWSHLKAFARAVPAAWKRFPPDDHMTASLRSFGFLLTCPFFERPSLVSLYIKSSPLPHHSLTVSYVDSLVMAVFNILNILLR